MEKEDVIGAFKIPDGIHVGFQDYGDGEIEITFEGDLQGLEITDSALNELLSYRAKWTMSVDVDGDLHINITSS